MPDPIIQIGTIIKKYQAIFAMFVGVATMSVMGAVAWQEVKDDTDAMRERIKAVEDQIAATAQKAAADHDILIRIDENVKSMGERLKRIEGQK